MATQRTTLNSTADFDFEAPLGEAAHGKLLIVNGAPKITIRRDASMSQLIRARFERPQPSLKVRDGLVQIHYPGSSLFNWLVYWRQPLADILINASIPWSIEGHGGVSRFEADLSQMQLTEIDLRGGAGYWWACLPEPSGTVPIHIAGGVSNMTMLRPSNVPLRLQIRGGVSSLTLDEQRFGAIGSLPRLETPGYNEAVNRYDVQIAGGVSVITIEKQIPVNQENGRRL